MLYSILIYGVEGVFNQLPEAQQAKAIKQHHDMQNELQAAKTLGPVVQLMGPSAAVTVRHQGDQTLVLDGPFAETKEQFLGFYVVECESLDDAIGLAKRLPGEVGAYEIRPVQWVPPFQNLVGDD